MISDSAPARIEVGRSRPINFGAPNPKQANQRSFDCPSGSMNLVCERQPLPSFRGIAGIYEYSKVPFPCSSILSRNRGQYHLGVFTLGETIRISDLQPISKISFQIYQVEVSVLFTEDEWKLLAASVFRARARVSSVAHQQAGSSFK